ncbi:hypothetical protein Tco_0941293 [Tanacetum coccineum]|uniref:Retroviral polymerase SH3-like domain-containing protein n=1 Tax=Tanacetum coccineum TaxID=301880 RepID=A0ABQ5DT30_9ASTR
MKDKKPDLSFFHVFGTLSYPTNDNDMDLGKLDAKADNGIFVGYAASIESCSGSIIKKRTWKIIETIHVTFDEMIAMASKQFSSGIGLHSMTLDAPSSSTPSTQEQEQSLNISQGFEESPKTPIFYDDPLNESPHEESPS